MDLIHMLSPLSFKKLRQNMPQKTYLHAVTF
jgi:hypothetical protein